MLLGDINLAAATVRQKLGSEPAELAVVLGSGLGAVCDHLSERRCLPYQDLPGFPPPAVAGHGGQVCRGHLSGRSLLLFSGRYHYYEGYSLWQVTAQVRLAAALGCRRILLTNAAGGISDALLPGDFMLVRDHFNLTGLNPLRGHADGHFSDLCGLYQQSFFSPLQAALRSSSIRLRSGVLAWMSGPSYETPAEIRALERLGADAVSMSTIPEAIVAGHLGMELAALSLISNKAAGKHAGALAHQEVLATAEQAQHSFQRLLSELLGLW